ncbi:NUDIX pyrophosphatase, partial [Vibrio parahaemolyticus]
WCGFQEASELLKYDSNRIALWELNQRLNSNL